jgi:hypothetical protein
MLGLGPAAMQDENDGAVAYLPVPAKSMAGAVPPSATPLRPGLASARKGLGGLALGPGTARKALGNITNANAASDAKGAGAHGGPAACGGGAAALDARAEALAAEGGIERLAGKGWAEQERDRVAREDDEMLARLEAAAAGAVAAARPRAAPRAAAPPPFPDSPPASPGGGGAALDALFALRPCDLDGAALPLVDVDEAALLAGADDAGDF